jgi:hypothetical protein
MPELRCFFIQLGRKNYCSSLPVYKFWDDICLFISFDAYLHHLKNQLVSFYLIRFSILVLSFFLGISGVYAQNLSHTHAVAISGGGISLVNGVAALSHNPANLMMKSYKHGRVIELPGWALQSENGNLSTNKDEFSFRWLEPILIDSLLFNNSWLEPYSTEDFGSAIIQSWRRETSIQFLGAVFTNSSWAWGLQVRNRSIGFSTISKDYFVNNSALITDQSVRNFTQTLLNWNEVTLGLATSLDYIEGLSSNLNRIYFGLSASMLLPYSYLELSASESVNKIDENRVQNMNISTFGNASRFIENMASGIINPWKEANLNTSELPTSIGIGAGLNLGLTYEIPFFSSYSEVRANQPVTRALRFGMSITDIGFVNLNDSQLRRSVKQDTLALVANEPIFSFNRRPTVSFTDTYLFLSQQNLLERSTGEIVDNEQVTAILPMQAHVGISLSYDWLKLGADAHYGLNTSLGNEQLLRLSLFSELYMLPFLPIRAGMLTQGSNLEQVSAGLSFQFYYLAWDLALAYNYSSNMDIQKPSIFAGTGLRIRF